MPVIAPLLLTVVLSVQGGQQPPLVAPAPVAASPWTDDHPITRFFQNFKSDFVHLAAPESAALVITGASFAAAAHTQDAALAQWVSTQGSSKYAAVGDVIGNRWVQGSFAVGLWVAGEAIDHPKLRHIGSDLMRAQVISLLLTSTVKWAVNRERPNGEDYSFPSGHTSAVFTTAAVLQKHCGWKIGAVAYGVAGFVGWSRVRSNDHWLSDVAMGAAVGMIAAQAVVGTHTGRWVISPVKTAGGMAVFVTRLPARSFSR